MAFSGSIKKLIPKVSSMIFAKKNAATRERASLRDALSQANFSRLDEEDVKEMGLKKGGKVSSASKRADGCATKGKTRGKMV
jgi:hypothetical protein